MVSLDITNSPSNYFKMTKFSAVALAALSCGVLLFSSCKKDKDSPKDLLSAPTCWKTVKSETRDAGTTTWTDETASCSTDDCTSFASSGTYSFDEGATKYDPTDPQSSTGTFTLSDDGKILTITDSGFSLPFTVEELTSDKLVLTISFLGDTRTTFEAK